MRNNIKLPTSVRTIKQTIVVPNGKPETLAFLTQYVQNYVENEISGSYLTNTRGEKIQFIHECKMACKLAVKVIQEAKNHKGTVCFTNREHYGKLQFSKAIKLYHILIGEEPSGDMGVAEKLDMLCKHENTVIPNRKLSFWGTNYTAHAEKFRQFINNSLESAVYKINLDKNFKELINKDPNRGLLLAHSVNFIIHKKNDDIYKQEFELTVIKNLLKDSGSSMTFEDMQEFLDSRSVLPNMQLSSYFKQIISDFLDSENSLQYQKFLVSLVPGANSHFIDNNFPILTKTTNAHLTKRLDIWIKEAPREEKENRSIAKSRILKAYGFRIPELILCHLRLTSLPVGVLYGLTNLKRLNLSCNELSTLPDGIFNGLANLEELDLHSNDLSELPNGVFNGLINLKRLNLNPEDLSELPVGIFNGLTNLEELYLNSDELSELPVGIFNGLTNLKRLNLHSNKLSTLPDGIFNGLANLEELNLHSNDLSELPVGIFNGLTNLKRLNLYSYKLSKLPDGIFNGLTNLKELNLNSEKLSELPVGIFNNLTNLQDLWLFYNHLSSLPDGIFNGLTNLQDLWLSHSDLSSLPDGIFNGLANLRGGKTLKLLTMYKQWLRREKNIEFYRYTLNNLFNFSRPKELNYLLENHGEIIPEDAIRDKYMQTNSIRVVQAIRAYVQGAGRDRRINLPQRTDMQVNGRPLAGIAFDVHNFTDGIESAALKAIDEFLTALEAPQPKFAIDDLRKKFSLIENGQLQTKANNALNRLLGSENYKEKLELALPIIAAFLNLDHTTWETAYHDANIYWNTLPTDKKVNLALKNHYEDPGSYWQDLTNNQKIDLLRELRWTMWLTQSFVEAGTAYDSGSDSTSCVKGVYERLITGFRTMHPIIDCLFIAQNITKGLELNIINLLKKEKLINNVMNELRRQGLHEGLPIAKEEFKDKLKLAYIKAIEQQLKHKIEKKLSAYLDLLTDFDSLKDYLAKEANERNSQIINDTLEKFNASLDYLEDIEVEQGKKVLTLENYIKDQLGIEFLPRLVAV